LAASADSAFRAKPEVFVGTAGQCSPAPAGGNIVTSAWLPGIGLPDEGSANPPTPNTNPSRNSADPQLGLLLSKNGLTTNCSSADATIQNFSSGTTITTLGFDFRLGGHCGAGAPRFNVTAVGGTTYFVGCASGVHTPAPQDPQWERVRFSNADFFPAGFVIGTTPVQSIEIIFDEGTDTSSVSDPTGVGLTVLDNIYLNHSFIKTGTGTSPSP